MKYLRVFEKYLQKSYHTIPRSELEEHRAFTVDLADLLNDESVKAAIPDFKSLVRHSPEMVINCLGLAMHQVSYDMNVI